MKVLCTICARGGSQGVKNKNISDLCGKPLIAHTINQAKKSGLFDVLAVSTDSLMIRDVALQFGVDIVIERPDELATSVSPKIPAIRHAVLEAEKIKGSKFDILVDLDATSPLRMVDDIHNAFNLFINNQNAANLVTGYPARRSPYFNILEEIHSGFVKISKPLDKSIFRRQDSPLCYDMNASIYIWRREALFDNPSAITDKTILYVMPEERSIDIDSELDLEFVRLLAKNRKDMN